ncbi:hypothetical protein LXL04_029733 [Taraxacum kok-saghyz]
MDDYMNKRFLHGRLKKVQNFIIVSASQVLAPEVLAVEFPWFGEYLAKLGSFENSYIPENPRTFRISYISQTVIPFKKPTLGPSKTFITIIIR